MSDTHLFGAKVAKYVNLRAPGADQELPPHEVFNNALTIAESVGEKPSVELFKHIDNEYAEAKQKEKMAMNLIQFGAKVAADPRPMNPDPIGARDHLAGHVGAKLTRDIGLIKKLRQQGQLPPSGDVSHLFPKPPTLHSPDPRPLNRLWSTPPDQRAPNPYSVKPAAPTNAPPTIKGAYAFGAKIAASSCAPCDMPNSPTNKKHMTGASPAVLEADEASEAIKPKTTETKHDKSVVTGGKEARTKRAAPFGLPPVNPAINIQLPSVHDVAKQTALFTAPLGAVVGGAIGGFGSKKDKLRNTLLGALKGTAVGAAGGAGTVYGGRYLPELIGNTTGVSAAVPSAVLAGGAGGGLLAGGLTGAGFDAIAGNKEEEEEPKKQAQAFGAAVKRSFDLKNLTGNAPPTPQPVNSPRLTSALDQAFTAPRPTALEREIAQRTDSAYPQIQPRPTLNPKSENIFNYSGPRNSFDTVVDAGSAPFNALYNALFGPKSPASSTASAARPASSGGYRAPTMVPDMSVTSGTGAVAAAPAAATHNTAPIRMPSPAVKPPAEKPGMFDGIDARTALMYGLPIGLGGAGLYGLYNYLNSQPKKKTEDSEPKKKTEDEKEKA